MECCKIRTLFSYQGSKYNELNEIFEMMEDMVEDKGKGKIFVDVFGGLGTVSLNIKNNFEFDNYHYNELNPLICKCMNMTPEEIDEFLNHPLLKRINNNFDEEEWRAIKKNVGEFFNTLGISSLAKYYYLICVNFRSMIMSSTLNKTKAIKDDGTIVYKNTFRYNEKRIKTAFERVYKVINDGNNWQTTNMDYLKILDQYKNDENAILYLDPPYQKTDNSSYYKKVDKNDIKIMYEKIHKYIKDEKTKCTVILHTNFLPYYYAEMDKYIYGYYNIKLNLNIFNNSYHCFITNKKLANE